MWKRFNKNKNTQLSNESQKSLENFRVFINLKLKVFKTLDRTH